MENEYDEISQELENMLMKYRELILRLKEQKNPGASQAKSELKCDVGNTCNAGEWDRSSGNVTCQGGETKIRNKDQFSR